MLLRFLSLAALIAVSYTSMFSTAQASPKAKGQADPRSAEAKSNLGTISRAQQAFWLENKNRFAADIKQLDAMLGVKFYDYKIVSTGAQHVFMEATPTMQGLRPYIAGSAYPKGTDNFLQIICEGQQIGKIIASPIFDGKTLKCGKGTIPIE